MWHVREQMEMTSVSAFSVWLASRLLHCSAPSPGVFVAHWTGNSLRTGVLAFVTAKHT